MKEILTLLWLAWYKMFTETHLIIDSRRETKIFLPSYPVDSYPVDSYPVNSYPVPSQPHQPSLLYLFHFKQTTG